MQQYLDLALLFYFLTAVVSTYGFLLFAYWDFVRGSSPAVYKYVKFLYLGGAIQFWGAFAARILFFGNDYSALNSWWWDWRCSVSFIFFTAIASHMSYRVFYLRHHGRSVTCECCGVTQFVPDKE